MPEWLFIGYLILSFISLVAAVYVVQSRKNSSYATLNMGVIAVVGTLLMMVPLFYLIYVGMIPEWKIRIIYLLANYLLPLVWAHLAVYAWGTGKTFWERYALGIAFFLTVPVLFLGIWVEAMVRFPFSILLADWGLLLISLTIWLKSRIAPVP